MWSLLIDGGGNIVVGTSSRRQSIKGDFGKLTVLSPLLNNDWPQGITIKKVPEELKTSPAQLSPLLGELTIKEIFQD